MPRIYCKECGTVLSKEVYGPLDESRLFLGEGEDHLPPGNYALVVSDYLTSLENALVINRADKLSLNFVQPINPHYGCCGLDGGNGPNLQCNCGHLIATELSECYLPYGVVFEIEKVELKDET